MPSVLVEFLTGDEIVHIGLEVSEADAAVLASFHNKYIFKDDLADYVADKITDFFWDGEGNPKFEALDTAEPLELEGYDFMVKTGFVDPAEGEEEYVEDDEDESVETDEEDDDDRDDEDYEDEEDLIDEDEIDDLLDADDDETEEED